MKVEWQDGWMRREREGERRSVKLLCTSLTSWTESAQLLKREMGKTQIQTHTHTHTFSHLQTNMLTHNSEVSCAPVSVCQLSVHQASW